MIVTGNPIIGDVIGGRATASPMSAVTSTQYMEPSPARSTQFMCSAKEYGS